MARPAVARGPGHLRRTAIVAVTLAAVAVLSACSTGGSTSSGSATGRATATTPGDGSASTAEGDQEEILPAPVTGGTTIQPPATPAKPPPGIPGLLAWNTEGYPGAGTPGPRALQNTHVPGPVSYSVLPPVGGPHNPIWMNAGVYTRPVPSERAVHLLEHGAVWITYRPSLPADDIRTLTDFVGRQSMLPSGGASAAQTNRYIVLSPWADDELPAPVVITAWGYQLRVATPGDPRLQVFVDTFRSSAKYSPEHTAPADGVPVLTGGRPASSGSALPNPEGSVPPAP